jgi:hypothetical protein
MSAKCHANIVDSGVDFDSEESGFVEEDKSSVKV